MSRHLTNKGFVGGAILRLILLFIVLAELTFLATRYRVRSDLTADQLYTLTSSTQTVLGKLQDRLLIEAYFSPKHALPILEQPRRAELVNLLEEYEKLSLGKVKIQFIDPTEDKTKRETAERLGVTPQQTGQVERWQGLRLRYGGKKQEIVPYLPFPPQQQHATAYYEQALTPMIKRLTLKEKPRVGILAFSSRPGSGGISFEQGPKTPPQHFSHIVRVFSREYDLRRIDITKGQLIPNEIKIAMLIRPKYLSDRTKYIFDQFLMRGGKLVVFADTCEVEVRQDRALRGKVVPYDAAAGKHRFLDMMKHYGVQIRNQIVADGMDRVQQPFYDVRQDQRSGQQTQQLILYPFIFEAANQDWKQLAEMMATRADGSKDEPLAKQYRDQVKPGMNLEHDLIKPLERLGAPGFFWPCPVGLANLPKDVKGDVLLRSSPISWTEPPQAALDPFDEAPTHQHREHNLRNWVQGKVRMRPRLPQQLPLMVQLTGKFTSYFADKGVPSTPVEKKTDTKKVDDWGDDTPKKKDGDLPKPADPAKKTAQKEQPEHVEAKPGATLVVVGDATFLRDDFISGMYSQPATQHPLPVYGPHARSGRVALLFVKSILDSMAQEKDLQGLFFKTRTDRTMKVAEQNVAQQETMDEFIERVRDRQGLIRWTNSVLPAGVLLLLGVFVWVIRRQKKRTFLATL